MVRNCWTAQSRTQWKREASDAECHVPANCLGVRQGFLDPPEAGTRQFLKSSSYKGRPNIHASEAALPTFLPGNLGGIRQPLHSIVCTSDASPASVLPPQLTRLA